MIVQAVCKHLWFVRLIIVFFKVKVYLCGSSLQVFHSSEDKLQTFLKFKSNFEEKDSILLAKS